MHRSIKKTVLVLLLTGFLVSPFHAFALGDTENTASFTLTAIGDVMMHDEQIACALTESGSYDVSCYFAMLYQRLSHSDVTIANMEAPVVPSRPPEGFPHFNAPSQLLDALKAAGVDIISVCNNHSLDQKTEGARETIAQAINAGLVPIGMYDRPDAYFTPYLTEINGIQTAFLAYTEHINGQQVHYNANELNRLIKIFDPEEAGFDILTAKRAGADVVVVFMHWGTEYELAQSSRIEKLAQNLAESGADIILGSHPHVVQSAEIKTVTRSDGREHEVFISYSMGNFISNQTKKPRQYGIIFDLSVAYDFNEKLMHIRKASYTPTYVWKRYLGSGHYNYSVLACTDFMESPDESMSESDIRHIRQAYDHINRQMEGTGLTLFDYIAKMNE